MRHSESWIKAFGLTFIAALGLMAFTAVVAQAEVLTDGGKAGSFQISKGGALLATLTGKSEGHIRILEPGRNLTILCSKLEFLEGEILSSEAALVKILYLECIALLFSKESVEIPCKLVGGGILTQLRALAKTHEGNPYILLEGDPTTIGVIQYESGTGCPLPLNNSIVGSVIGEVTPGEGVSRLIQFKEPIQKLFQDKINYGTLELILDANIVLELTGAHAGQSWGIS